jgi:hypothetical protein
LMLWKDTFQLLNDRRSEFAEIGKPLVDKWHEAYSKPIEDRFAEERKAREAKH